jgi:disulfide bond formation protein DsbB
MIYSQRNRAKLFILAIACLCMVGSALFIQVQFHEDPCPLCILQRYLFILTALLARTAASLKTRHLMYFLAGLGALSAIIGAILAAKQILIQIKSTFSCGFDLLEPFVDGLPPRSLATECLSRFGPLRNRLSTNIRAFVTNLVTDWICISFHDACLSRDRSIFIAIPSWVM